MIKSQNISQSQPAKTLKKPKNHIKKVTDINQNNTSPYKHNRHKSHKLTPELIHFVLTTCNQQPN